MTASRLHFVLLLGLLLGSLLRPAPAHARAQDAYDQAVAASRAGDNDAAVAQFAAALEAGAVDPEVFHGLGNALYRQGHLGHAVAAWTRGLQLAPTDGDLAANRALARARTQDRLDPPEAQTGPFFWQAVLPPATEALLAGGLVALGLVLQLVVVLRARARGWTARLRWEAAVPVVLGLVLAMSAWLHARQLPPATVLASEVRVRSALGAEGVELFVLHQGAVVRTLESYADGGADAAVLVELPDARKGWVPRSAVDLADPAAPFPLP